MNSRIDLEPPGREILGPGPLCAEAQADGVPCTELDRDCEICERASPAAQRPRVGQEPQSN